MATLYTEQSKNVRKTWFLMAVFLCVVIALGWFLSYAYQAPEILYAAVVLSILTNVGSYWFSDRLVLMLTHARAVTRQEQPVLYTTVENLSITAGLPMPRVYLIDDPVPNAFATGRNKEHAVVAVTTGLMAMMNRVELEGVIAHELSHIGNRDMLVSTVAVVLVGFVTIVSDMFLRMGLHGRNRDNHGNRAGAIIMLIGIIFAVLSPIAATLIRLAISRKREFLADASGSLLTRYPEGLASALEKLGRYGGKMRYANNATAHLFIANPFGGKEGENIGFLPKLFMTHPPVSDRVRVLRAH